MDSYTVIATSYLPIRTSVTRYKKWQWKGNPWHIPDTSLIHGISIRHLIMHGANFYAQKYRTFSSVRKVWFTDGWGMSAVWETNNADRFGLVWKSDNTGSNSPSDCNLTHTQSIVSFPLAYTAEVLFGKFTPCHSLTHFLGFPCHVLSQIWFCIIFPAWMQSKSVSKPFRWEDVLHLCPTGTGPIVLASTPHSHYFSHKPTRGL